MKTVIKNACLVAAMAVAAVGEGVEVTSDTTVDSSNCATYTAADAIVVSAGATLTFAPGSGEKYSIAAPISGAGSLAMSGAGELELRGDNSFTGGATIGGGVTHVYSATAFGTTDGATTVQSAQVKFHAVDCAENFTLNSCGALVAAEGTCNLTGTFTYSSNNYGDANSPVGADSGATLRLSGRTSAEIYGDFGAYGRGTVEFAGDYIFWKSFWLSGMSYFTVSKPLVIKDSSCVFYVQCGVTLTLGAADAISNAKLSLGEHPYDQRAYLDLGGFDQTFRDAWAGNAKPVVTSATAAQCRLLACATSDNWWKFSGAAGFTWAGGAGSAIVLQTASDTVGSLMAESGTVELASAATWLNATNVVVAADGRLVLSAEAFGQAATLSVADGGKILVPAGVTQRVKRFAYAGQSLAVGTYSASGSGADFATAAMDAAGTGVIQVVGEDQIATWDGGPDGKGTDFTDPANWEGDPTDLDFANGCLTVTLSGANCRPQVTGAVRLKGIVFAGDNGVVLTAANGGRIDVGGGGVTASAPSSSAATPTHVIQAPLALATAQTWTVAGGTTVSLESSLSGADALTRAGAGSLLLKEDGSAYFGAIVMSDGVTHLYTDTALGAATAGTTVTGGKLRLHGVTCADALTVNVGNDVVWGDEGVSVLSGNLTYNNSWGPFGAEAGAELHFTGAHSGNRWYRPWGSGLVAFDGDVTISANGFYVDGNYHLHAGAPLKGTYSIYAQHGGTVSAGVKDAYANAHLSLGENATWYQATFDLGGFDQTVRSAWTDRAGPVVTSSAPAQMRVLSAATGNNSCTYTGLAGFTWAGGADSEMTMRVVSDSAGSVKAESGRLTFAAGATWLNATNVTVASGASLRLEAAAFGDQAEIAVADGGRLVLADGLVQRVARFVYAGQEMVSGTYGRAGSGAMFQTDAIDPSYSGILQVTGGAVVERTAVWTGGPSGTGTSLTDPANWEGAPTDLDFVHGGLTARFPANASGVTVSSPVFLKGMVFAGGQSVKIGGASGLLLLGAGGIVVENPSGAAVTHELTVGTSIAADQAWSVAEGATLKVTAGLVGGAKVTKTGAGGLDLAGNSGDYAGSFRLEGGETFVRTDTALGNGAGTVSVINGAVLWLCGVSTPAKLRTESCGWGSNAHAIRSLTQTTNVVSGVFELESHSLYADTASALTFTAGGTVYGMWEPKGASDALIAFDVAPVTFSQHLFADVQGSGPKVRLGAAHNSFSGCNVYICHGHEIVCGAAYALDYGPGLCLTGGNWAGTKNVFDLNGFDQGVKGLEASDPTASPAAGTGFVRSAAPAALRVANAADSANFAVFEGQAGFSNEGAGQTVLGAVSPSRGTLAATAGTLRLGDGAAWMNCTNVVVSGTGCWSIGHAKSVGRRTDVYLSDFGTVSIDAGVTETVGNLYLKVGDDWVRQPAGTYGAQAPAEHVDAVRFRGEGLLYVRATGPGTAIVIR